MTLSFFLLAGLVPGVLSSFQPRMGNQMHQMETAALSVISHLEAAKGHSLLTPFSDKGHLVSRRQNSASEPDIGETCPEAEQIGTAHPAFAAFNETCTTFQRSFSEMFDTNDAANAMCTNPCLATMLDIFTTTSLALPNTEGCSRMKMMMRLYPRLINGVVCATNHMNWRCGAVFGNLDMVGSEAVAGSGAGSGALEGSGAAPATMFGITLTQDQRSQYTGICGQFQAAGCCMSTMVSVYNDPDFRTMLDDSSQAFTAAAFESGVASIKTGCTSLGRPSNYIGAPPCQIASVRSGGIAAGTIDIARRVVRLVMTFPGDLGTASDAFKARIINRVTTELNALLGDGAVTEVVLSSGSINAVASFADDVTESDVAAAASSSGITELTVVNDEGTAVTASNVAVSSDSPSTSAASNPPTNLPTSPMTNQPTSWQEPLTNPPTMPSRTYPPTYPPNTFERSAGIFRSGSNLEISSPAGGNISLTAAAVNLNGQDLISEMVALRAENSAQAAAIDAQATIIDGLLLRMAALEATTTPSPTVPGPTAAPVSPPMY